MPTQNFRIIGYVTDWDNLVNPIQFDQLTHLNYAFVVPNADGSIKNIANGWKLKDIVAKAHANRVKVLISVGGWGPDQEFEALAAQPETRSRFVRELDRFAKDYDLDGLDIDWEYPKITSAQNFAALMRELNAVTRGENKLLTAAVVAQGSNGEGVLPEVFELVDFLNIMAYDGPDTNHSSYPYAVAAIEYWNSRGLAADKMVLGVPFYSRPGEVAYRKLVEADPRAATADQSDYQGTTTYYNGLSTIQQKTQLALKRASGIMIWALASDTNDATSLLKAIHSTAEAH